jgi:hypothetical protein
MTNRKDVVNHRGSHKNIGKAKGAVGVSGTHGSDRKTRTICDHDERGVRERRRMHRRKYIGFEGGVVSGTRVGDPG